MWCLNAQTNNVNSMEGVNRSNVYTLGAGARMLAVQLEMTRRLVEEVKVHDNVALPCPHTCYS